MALGGSGRVKGLSVLLPEYPWVRYTESRPPAQVSVGEVTGSRPAARVSVGEVTGFTG